jgi:hypothetical protein
MFLTPFRVNELLKIEFWCSAPHPRVARKELNCLRRRSKSRHVNAHQLSGEGRLAKNLAKLLSNAKGWAGG